ncbi:LamG-like jellyroll fold domain-containing protein [Primorskyibacter sp. S87]|uniref:LamG-like jellyroll fold domain-containing protein n=1 Tax=Primorskyibacter sp. S87 TaxID=3415126 RepID=UPI003C7A023D
MANKQNPLSIDPTFSSLNTRTYTGSEGDYMDVGHHASLSLGSGTISLSFSASSLPGDQAILSKDGSGRENGGHLTVWLKDGTLIITQENATSTEWLKVPELVLNANQTYHLGLSFGEQGLQVWLDGALVAAEPEFKQGIDMNDRSLVIGGSRAWRDNDGQSAHSLFQGEIGDVMVFDRQLGGNDMRSLASAVDPALDDAAKMDALMEDLLPLLGDIHHGSDTLKQIMQEYGVSEHGHFANMLPMRHGSSTADTVTGTDSAEAINGWSSDDLVDGRGGNDVLQGSYGNDTLMGGTGNDILDGGHGEDSLLGGDGNDLLISRADGREGEIFYDPNRSEGDPLGELTNGKLYPDQPIPADDVLIGGAGADIFYFQTLINAKQRYIEKHTRDDGSINWHGVAGENDKLHDHWVDIMGKDVVKDFSRAEGDRLVIEGHTTKILSVSYGDINSDGIMDHSVISLYSDQGNNGGAHNDDRLGQITVYGDLVKLSDIEQTSKPAYGIIHSIDDLREAVAPQSKGTEAAPIAPPARLPAEKDLNIGNLKNPVFAMTGTNTFKADERAPMIVDHTDRLDLVQGTIAFNFQITELLDHQVLFSKDAEGYGNGGHITAFLDSKGSLLIRLQDINETFYLKAQLGLQVDKSYDFGLTFGEHGVELSLDGARVAFDPDIVFDLAQNTEALIIGASGWNNAPGQTDRVGSHFSGTISDFVIFDQPLTTDQMKAAGFGKGEIGQLGNSSGNPGMDVYGSTDADVLNGGEGDDYMSGAANNDQMIGAEGNDTIEGGTGDDTIDGGIGNDRLNGDLGDDVLKGGAGSDWLTPGSGSDMIDGGAGTDMVSFFDLSKSVRVLLKNGTVESGTDSNTIVGVENVTGSVFGDYIEGNDGANRLRGLGDYDWMVGSGGGDTFDGGNGRDMVSYVHSQTGVIVDLGLGLGLAGQAQGDRYTSIERVTGSVFNDKLLGSEGEDDFRGLGGYDWFVGSGGGKDRYDGGSGDDMVAYSSSTSGVEASLLLGRGSKGDAAQDLYTSIEGLTGSGFDDILTGDHGRNRLRGLNGEDTLIGNAGVDRLEGGKGNDILDGGADWDYAIFSGNRSDYDISTLGMTTTVRDLRVSGDGLDTLVNIEALQFADDIMYL